MEHVVGTGRRRVVVVEPYLGGSHWAWVHGFAAHSRHEVHVVGLPARHWKWRMRGAHLALADRLAELVDRTGPIDTLLVSSMADLAGLVGMARHPIGGATVAYYVHENQLTYPWSPGDEPDLSYAMTNWTSMVAADLVVFNSQFHRSEFFAALPGFLRRFPDHRRLDLVDHVRERSTVLPVGIDAAPILAHPRRRAPRPLVLWNQRWEYDQGPDEFADAIDALLDAGVDLDVALAGERAADVPPGFERLRTRLGDRLVADGHLDRDEYHRLLRRSDIVVSTALHEFYGVAITEAVVAGAFPVLPDRLVYPERVPAEHHHAVLYRTAADLVARIRWAIDHRSAAADVADAIGAEWEATDWARLAPRYDAALEEPTGTA